jgi:excisionase family DNA binding protein
VLGADETMKKQDRLNPLSPRYTIEEVAEAYGLHVETVRRWVTREGCPALSTGGTWRLDANELEAWLQQRGHRRARRVGGGGK